MALASWATRPGVTELINEMTPLRRWATPEEFKEWKLFGLGIGFGVVESGALVRSSYHADEQSQKYTGVDHLNTHNALAHA